MKDPNGSKDTECNYCNGYLHCDDASTFWIPKAGGLYIRKLMCKNCTEKVISFMQYKNRENDRVLSTQLTENKN